MLILDLIKVPGRATSMDQLIKDLVAWAAQAVAEGKSESPASCMLEVTEKLLGLPPPQSDSERRIVIQAGNKVRTKGKRHCLLDHHHFDHRITTPN